MLSNAKIITASSFGAMFFLGVGTAVIGAASRNIGLTPQQIGLLIAVQNLGFILSVTVAGTLADTFSKTKLMFWASLILAVSFYLFYIRGVFLLNILIMAGIGIGIGGYEGVTDAMLLDIHDRRESLFITINHFFVTFGALLITVYLIYLQMDWRKSIVQSAAVVFLLALVFAFSRVPSKGAVEADLMARLRFLLHQKPVLILFVLAACAVGIELATMGILTTYLMDLRDFDQTTSKLGLVTFLSGIACGRLFLGFIVPKARLLNTIVVLFGLVALSSGALYYVHVGNGATYGALFLTGLAISVLLPLIISLAGIRYGASKGMVMGVVKLGIPAGGILVPLFLSMLSRYASFEVALLLFPAIGLCGFGLLLVSRKAFQPSPTH